MNKLMLTAGQSCFLLNGSHFYKWLHFLIPAMHICSSSRFRMLPPHHLNFLHAPPGNALKIFPSGKPPQSMRPCRFNGGSRAQVPSSKSPGKIRAGISVALAFLPRRSGEIHS